MIRILLFSLLFSTVFAIQCYTGLRLLQGTSVGDATIQCDNTAAQCYNMTASTGTIIDVMKAGCSMWRCLLARDKCISTTFQNIPISLCCCTTDKCNVGQDALGGTETRGQISGNNASPNEGETDGTEPQNLEKKFTKEEIHAKFASAEIDDEAPTEIPRSSRFTSTMGTNGTEEEGEEIELL